MYTLKVLKRPQKEVAALPKKDQARIVAAFDVLQVNPFVGKKLHGDLEGAWSFRVWPYRIIYHIQKHVVTITVLTVRHRKDVYKKAA